MIQESVEPLHPDGFVVPLRHNVALDVQKPTHVLKQYTEISTLVDHHHHTQAYFQEHRFHEGASDMRRYKTLDWRSHYELRHVTHGVQECREAVYVDDVTRLPNVHGDDTEGSSDWPRVSEARTFAVTGSRRDATRTASYPHHDCLPHTRPKEAESN